MVADDPPFDELVSTIARHLEIDHGYTAILPPEPAEAIARVRAAGRKAGRVLGLSVFTCQTDPARREDGQVVVWVTLRNPPPEDDERMQARFDLVLDALPRPHRWLPEE